MTFYFIPDKMLDSDPINIYYMQHTVLSMSMSVTYHPNLFLISTSLLAFLIFLEKLSLYSLLHGS